MLIEKFLEVVEKNTYKTAVECEEKKITYKELNEVSSELADRILSAGIPEGSPIEIYMNKSIEFIVSILAVLKANCVYVPVDMHWPVKRIERIGEISGAKAQITFQHDFIINKLSYDNDDAFNLKKENAYIIFTSGSTGEPKGIPIRKESIINLIDGMREIIDERYNNISCVAPFCFDMSVAQMYYALLTGRKLVLVPNHIKLIPNRFCEYLDAHKVEVCDVTPTHLNMVLQYISVSENCKFTPKEIISSGEVLPIPVVQKFYEEVWKNNERIINLYGPTETCVYATAYIIDKNKAENLQLMKIGSPIKNMAVVILSEDNKKCEKGEVGEICIWGAGVSDGYIGNEEKKNKAFIKNSLYDGVIYKTGDYGYEDEENEFVCLGRKDDQVKIKGYRIELKEIEKAMEEIVSVNCAKAIVVGDFNAQRIVCFYTGSTSLTIDYIKEELKKKIPSYMIPGQIMQLEQFNSTINGKIDVMKLRELVKYEEIVKAEDLDSEILNICANILRVNPIDISQDTDFIAEGAESIDIMELFLEINTRYSVNIDMAYLFEHSRIGDYISEVKRLKGEIKPDIEEVNIAKVSWMILTCLKNERLENARKKIQYNVDFPAYNILHVIEVNEYIDSQKLKESLCKVISLHGAFHTTFYKEKGVYYAKKDNYEYKENTYYQYVKEIDDLNDKTLRQYATIFSIDQLPLFKLILFEHQSKQKVLLNIHHGIFDYFSMRIFLNQLFRVYKDIPISEEKTDYVSGLHMDMTRDLTQNQLFWREYLSKRDYAAKFPCLKGRESERIGINHHFSNYDYFLDKSNGRIKKLVKTLGVSEYILMISLFAILLSNYTGKDDIILGTYLPGRDEKKGQMVGMFTEMVALRFCMKPEQSIWEFMKEQQVAFRNVLKYQTIDLPNICAALDSEDFMKGQLFDVIFNYVNDINLEIDGLIVKAHEAGNEPEKMPFSIKLFSNDERIRVAATVCDEFYDKNMVDDIINRYVNLLDATLNNIEKSAELSLME